MHHQCSTTSGCRWNGASLAFALPQPSLQPKQRSASAVDDHLCDSSTAVILSLPSAAKWLTVVVRLEARAVQTCTKMSSMSDGVEAYDN